MPHEAEKVEGYLATLARMEPELHMVDRDAALPSIAISLKRIADSLDFLVEQIKKDIAGK